MVASMFIRSMKTYIRQNPRILSLTTARETHKASHSCLIGIAAAAVSALTLNAVESQEPVASAGPCNTWFSTTAACEALPQALNATELLRFYEEIDTNLQILVERLINSLQEELEEEKRSGRFPAYTKEQRALKMSNEFDQLLNQVQDSVFRNNGVQREQVMMALQQLLRGEIEGEGDDGRLSQEQHELFTKYVERLGRMRWACTGTRKSLMPIQSPEVPPSNNTLPLTVILSFLDEYFPLLNAAIDKLVSSVPKDDDRPATIAQLYIEKSGELTEDLCRKRNIDLVALQAALKAYETNPQFQEALAQHIATQQQHLQKAGLL